MTSDELRAFLGSVQEARFRYNRAVSREQELRERCESMTTNWSSEPHGSGDVHKDGPLVALAQAHAELKPLYLAWERAEDEVDRFLDGIPDVRHRAILKYRYVDLYKWPRVVAELERSGIYYEERQVYRIHGKALNVARELWRARQEEENHG
jgi:hypothetical protein